MHIFYLGINSVSYLLEWLRLILFLAVESRDAPLPRFELTLGLMQDVAIEFKKNAVSPVLKVG